MRSHMERVMASLPFQRILPLEHDFTPCVIRLPALATLYQIMDPASELRLQQIRIGLGDHRRQAEVLGVIGYNQEIQRALQARADARARSDFLAACESISLLRTKPATQHARISRVGGVQMRVASAEARGLQRLYVALTRAVSRLTVLYSEPLPAPLPS